MAPVRIRLTGIRAAGHHGANPGEQDQPQEFEVDLEVVVDPGGDHLDDTTDYRELKAAVLQAIAEESHQLLETIARSVVAAVTRDARVLEARAVVHKPRAAGSLGVADVSVEATSE